MILFPEKKQYRYFGNFNFSLDGGITVGTHITASGNIEVTGNISSSAAGTGSFGHIMKGGVNFDTAVSTSAAAAGFAFIRS